MENKKLTIADFKKEIDSFIEVFKDYCETFDIDLFSNQFFINPNDESLHNDREIKEGLISFFKPIKKEIIEYRYDYCSNKPVDEIAKTIEKDITRVIAYLERIKHTFNDNQIESLSAYNDVTEKTRVKYISSFRILKELQLVESKLLLKKLANKRK